LATIQRFNNLLTKKYEQQNISVNSAL